MATIQQDLAAIRTAVYGKDVREAIADGIENCYNESAQSGYSQLNNRMTVAEDNIQTLENTVDTMIGTDTTLINRITTAESNIDTLTEGQNTLGVDISAVSGRVDETETDIAVLESMTEPTRNKLYITNHQKPGSFTINGVTVTINTDGSFSFNGTVAGADVVIGLMGCTSKDDHKIPLGVQYTFGRKSENTGSNGTIRFRYDDESNQNVTISNGETITFLSKASVYLLLPIGQAYTSTGKYYFWAESGNTLHGFLPYGNTPVDITAREAIETSMTEAVLSNQGTENAGKALVVGDDGRVTTGDAGIPEAVKTALLDIFQHVAYADASGQTWYAALEEALNAGSVSHVLFSLETPITLNGVNQIIDSGVKLNDTDKSYTVLIDAIENNIDWSQYQTTTGSAAVLMLDRYGHRLMATSWANQNKLEYWFAQNRNGSGTSVSTEKSVSYSNKPTSSNKRIRLAITHSSGSNAWNMRYTVDGTEATGSRYDGTYYYMQSDYNVIAGGNNYSDPENPSNCFKATYNTFDIYDVAIDSSAVDAFIQNGTIPSL